jgi:hypothetical protein
LFAFLHIRLLWEKVDYKKQQYKEILNVNKCSLFVVRLISIPLWFVLGFYKIFNLYVRVIRKINRIIAKNSIKIYYNRSHNLNMTMLKASEITLKKVMEKELVQTKFSIR